MEGFVELRGGVGRRAGALAKRHTMEAEKDSASAQELLAKQVGTYDESELCKLLLGTTVERYLMAEDREVK